MARRKSKAGAMEVTGEDGRMQVQVANNTNGNPIDRRWWLLKGEDQANSIDGTLRQMYSNASRRRDQMVQSARLYGNLALLGPLGFNLALRSATTPGSRDRVTFNVVQSVIDAITAKLAKNKPKPMFLTNGGSMAQQRRAKKLNKFCDGIFYENDTHKLMVEAFRDACVWGTGVVHVFEHEGRVKHERTMPAELYVDEEEAIYGEPRELHRAKSVDRKVVQEMFPKHAKSLTALITPRLDGLNGAQTTSDLLEIRESWHLPSKDGAKDGRHVISCGRLILLDEVYARDTFPFAFFHWSKRLLGFWGQGLAEQIQSIQLEINRILWIIQRSMYLAGSFKVFLENGSKVVKEHLNNDIGAIVTYTGTKPEYVVPPIVAPEMYQHKDRLIESAYEQAGLSQLSAQSKKPEGLDSGKALREFNDIESDRFQVVGQDFERFALEIAYLSIETARDIGDMSIKAPDMRGVNELEWSEVEMDEDEYVLKCFPVSSLPDEPAGRLQTVQEYVQAGFITPRQARRLLAFPDTEQEDTLATAQEEYVDCILEGIVDHGDYTAPEPYDDLGLCRERALEYYSLGKRQGLEDSRLELLRRFMDQVDVLEQAANPPMPAGPPGAGGAPTAAPMPPPQSDMLPNAPGAAGAPPPPA